MLKKCTVLWALSSLLLIYIIIPICFTIATKMNKKTFLILSISLCSIILFDELYNLIIARLFDLSRASDIYKQLGFKYMEF